MFGNYFKAGREDGDLDDRYVALIDGGLSVKPSDVGSCGHDAEGGEDAPMNVEGLSEDGQTLTQTFQFRD